MHRSKPATSAAARQDPTIRPVQPGPAIAYFSMEIGLEAELPTYAGGLGVLAGDFARAAADLEVPLVAVSLLHREGYFTQRIAPDGSQREEPVRWNVDTWVTPLEPRVSVMLRGRPVHVAVWRYTIHGCGGFAAPVFLLDTDLEENDPEDRAITNRLYGGDGTYRLLQEAILGIGGLRMLRALGHHRLQRIHMNEGHASLLVLELLQEQSAAMQRPPSDPEVVEAVREGCVFTTHTPVEAGHDQFPMELVARILEPSALQIARAVASRDPAAEKLNLTYLGFNLSGHLNGVAKRHGQVSRQLFGDYPIDAITNGIHAPTWVSRPFAELFDGYIPDWREDSFSLRYAISIGLSAIADAHRAAKRLLLEHIERSNGVRFDPGVFTIGFGRRSTAYKRADLLFADMRRLRRIAGQAGPLQLVFAGKAHPNDQPGRQLVRDVITAMKELSPQVQGVYLANYDMAICQLMVAGVDLWLNTPQPPMEASGTSGMKAAVNGVPSLSILDGWWLEGCIEGITGWSIGTDHGAPATTSAPNAHDRRRDAGLLYDKLEEVILPMFYDQPERYLEVARYAIALNGSFFSARRMLSEYVTRAYV